MANGVLSKAANARGETAAAGHCRHEEQPISSGSSCNLYVEHYNGEAGPGEGWEAPRLVARISNEDEPDYQPANSSEGDLGVVTSRVAPNGRFLAFMSDRPLTGYDNEASSPSAHNAPAEEVFLYDAGTDGLVCASCDPSGARPVGVLDPVGIGEGQEGEGLLVDRPKAWEGRWLAGSVPGWTRVDGGAFPHALYQSRYLSDSGRVFFNSPEALVSADVNGKEDVYEYEREGIPRGPHECTSSTATFSPRSDGCVGLISSGTSDSESAFLDASQAGGEGEGGTELQEGGGDVFFVTAAKLVPGVEAGFDVYDAHECTSGSPCITPPQVEQEVRCESSVSCRPSSYSPATPGVVATGTSSGSGNLLPEAKVLSSKTSTPPKPKPLTRAQKLTKALAACRSKDKKKSKRVACEKRARRDYGPVKKPTKAKKSTTAKTTRQGPAR